MSRLTPDAVQRVAQACQANLGEIAAALSRGLDASFVVEIAGQRALALHDRPPDWSGPGLLVALIIEESAVLVIVPEATGLLPSWIARPDATGISKLTTLAQELGMLVLPDDLAASDFRAARVKNIAAALQATQVAPELGYVSLALTAGKHKGLAGVVWPAAQGGAPFSATAKGAASPVAQASARPPADNSVVVPSLPPYLESLLQIQVPLSVTLVSKRQPLQRILELGPGSILPFDKPCTEPLTLEVSGQGIALGEAVKIGDKFGLRITSLALPTQRLRAIKGRPRAG